MQSEPEKRVLMARRVAARWLARVAQAEYRFDVLYGSSEIRNLPNLLRSFRDGKLAMEGVPRVQNLGIRDSADALSLWSNDREGMLALKEWFEKRGYETTGIW